jgi:hypothetical protein
MCVGDRTGSPLEEWSQLNPHASRFMVGQSPADGRECARLPATPPCSRGVLVSRAVLTPLCQPAVEPACVRRCGLKLEPSDLSLLPPLSAVASFLVETTS